MSNAKIALFAIGIALLTLGCGQRPGSGQIRATQAQLADDAARALEEFEQEITRGSTSERESVVYSLDKYVRQHAIVVERLLKMLHSEKDPALRGAAARTLALTADGGDVTLESDEQRRQVRALHTLMGMKEKGSFALPQLRKSIK